MPGEVSIAEIPVSHTKVLEWKSERADLLRTECKWQHCRSFADPVEGIPMHGTTLSKDNQVMSLDVSFEKNVKAIRQLLKDHFTTLQNSALHMLAWRK